MIQETRSPSPTERIIISALWRAQEIAGRSLRIGPDGIVVTGAFGDSYPLLHGGQAVTIDMADVASVLDDHRYRDHSLKGGPNDVLLPELETWNERSRSDEAVVLHPRKPIAPCIEAVLGTDVEGLDVLRRCYGMHEVDILVSCEGETRSRNLALAMACERRLSLGLATAVRVPPLDARHDHWRRWPTLQGEDLSFLDSPVPALRPEWRIDAVAKSLSGLAGQPHTPDTRVRIASEARLLGRDAVARHLGTRPVPSAFVWIRLENSEVRTRIEFSPSFLDLTAGVSRLDGPWTEFVERKAMRERSRPSPPKTWFQSTEGVAKAFVARRSPRGYVSSRSLYFHGPIAYSISDRNPIAAIMDGEGDPPILLIGREDGWGGTKAGTISSAQGDIIRAAGKDFEIVDVGVDLSSFVLWGEYGPRDAARIFRGSKAESSQPAGCAIDGPSLTASFDFEEQALLDDLEDALKSSFPTTRIVNAYRALERHARVGERLADLAEEPGLRLGSPEPYREAADAVAIEVARRQEELRRRRVGSPEHEANPMVTEDAACETTLPRP